MKILHTSDWHLGRKFEQESLESFQIEFINWLVELVRARCIDLVVIAGDIYDRSTPAEEAVALFDTALTEIRAAGAQVAAIPGNHDSLTRIGFGERILASGGVHVRGSLDHNRVGTPFLLQFDDGPLAIVAVPFLDPTMYFRKSFDDQVDAIVGPRTHEGALRHALSRSHSQIKELGATRSIAIAHAFVAGAPTYSDSERVLPGGTMDRVGGTDRVALDTFKGFSYTALGHLHSPQGFENNRVAYSGSPLPYSFSEERAKSVRIIEMGPAGEIETEIIEIPCGRGVATLEGTIDQILTDPRHEHAREKWVCVKLEDTGVLHNPFARILERFPFVVARKRSKHTEITLGISPHQEQIENLDPDAIAGQYWNAVRGTEPTAEERKLLVEAIEQGEVQ